MRISIPILAAAVLAACTAEAPLRDDEPVPAPAPAEPAESRSGLDWQAEAVGAGHRLRLSNLATGAHLLTISCLAPSRLTVHAPAFTPIGSEDRFSFGIGAEPVTLVANPYEQQRGAGVTAEGPIPDNLETLFAGADTIGALYGTQQVGPHAAPPEILREPFLRACTALRDG